jgi:hypothetical protein
LQVEGQTAREKRIQSCSGDESHDYCQSPCSFAATRRRNEAAEDPRDAGDPAVQQKQQNRRAADQRAAGYTADYIGLVHSKHCFLRVDPAY